MSKVPFQNESGWNVLRVLPSTKITRGYTFSDSQQIHTHQVWSQSDEQLSEKSKDIKAYKDSFNVDFISTLARCKNPNNCSDSCDYSCELINDGYNTKMASFSQSLTPANTVCVRERVSQCFIIQTLWRLWSPKLSFFVQYVFLLRSELGLLYEIYMCTPLI